MSLLGLALSWQLHDCYFDLSSCFHPLSSAERVQVPGYLRLYSQGEADLGLNTCLATYHLQDPGQGYLLLLSGDKKIPWVAKRV